MANTDRTMDRLTETTLQHLSDSSGRSFRRDGSIREMDPRQIPGIVVTLVDEEAISARAAAHPQVQFVAIGIEGLEPAENLSLIGAQGKRQDQLIFLAGYLSALITPDWRTAVLRPSTISADLTLDLAYRSGAHYYCGLCRVRFPPFRDYPLVFTLAPQSSEQEWQSVLRQVAEAQVGTLFLYRLHPPEGASSELEEEGLAFVGLSPPSDPFRPRWAASISFDPSSVLHEKWGLLLEGEGGWVEPLPIGIHSTNPEILSPGRLARAEQLADALALGLVNPGVTPVPPRGD